MNDLALRKFYMAGGSLSVSHYWVQHDTVYVQFKDGRTVRSRTLRDVDAMRRALVQQTLTTTPPIDHRRKPRAAAAD